MAGLVSPEVSLQGVQAAPHSLCTAAALALISSSNMNAPRLDEGHPTGLTLTQSTP